MQKYVKIIADGAGLDYAPQNKGAVSNWINDTAAVLADGYLPLAETPEPQDGKRYARRYEEQNGQIVAVWTEQPLTRGEVEQKRRELYRELTDELAAEYTRKSILGTLTDEKKAELETQIRNISAQIVADNPYQETVENKAESEGENA